MMLDKGTFETLLKLQQHISTYFTIKRLLLRLGSCQSFSCQKVQDCSRPGVAKFFRPRAVKLNFRPIEPNFEKPRTENYILYETQGN